MIARIGSRQSKRERSEKSTWSDTTIGGLPIWGNVSDFFGHAGDCDKERKADLDGRQDRIRY